MEKFDWHKDAISDDTLITGSYKNTQNVRRYFKSRCGEHFKFNRDFMQWMKNTEGSTMGDAVEDHNHQATIMLTGMTIKTHALH